MVRVSTSNSPGCPSLGSAGPFLSTNSAVPGMGGIKPVSTCYRFCTTPFWPVHRGRPFFYRRFNRRNGAYACCLRKSFCGAGMKSEWLHAWRSVRSQTILDRMELRGQLCRALISPASRDDNAPRMKRARKIAQFATRQLGQFFKGRRPHPPDASGALTSRDGASKTSLWRASALRLVAVRNSNATAGSAIPTWPRTAGPAGWAARPFYRLRIRSSSGRLL